MRLRWTKSPDREVQGSPVAAASGWRAAVARYTPALLGIIGLYAGLQIVNQVWFGVGLQAGAVPLDLALHLVIGVALLHVSRGRLPFFLVLALLMTIVHVGNAIKISVLGGPIMPDDILATRSLLLIMETWQLVLTLGLASLLAVSVLRAFTLKPWRARLTVAGVAALAGLVALDPARVVEDLDARFGNVVWDQRGNYLARGPILHTIQESARYAARGSAVPDAGRVERSAALLGAAAAWSGASLQKAGFSDAQERHAVSRHGVPLPTRKPTPEMMTSGGMPGSPGRNVHMIVLESFFDPSILAAAGFSRDPFDETFRALWEAGGSSRVLAPVFGGYTANSEFEALCGFPVIDDAVFFEGRLRNDAACLPRLFADAGYHTQAAHPNDPVFWNRKNAYRRVGFAEYRAKEGFLLDDMNGEFLSDSSLYRQVLEQIDAQEEARPVFNYILTFFGHLEFPLNAARSRVVEVARDAAGNHDEWLERYANTVYWKSREFMEFLAQLRARDPEGIVVVFGDHLPFLGANFASYVASGALAPDRSQFADEMFVTQFATPVIVIDGRNGVVDLGTMPLYHLPSVVKKLAGVTAPAPMDVTAGSAGAMVRPLPGLQVVLDEGSVDVCRGEQRDAASCGAVAAWVEAVDTLAADLFTGDRHLLRESLGTADPLAVADVSLIAGAGS